VLSCSHYTYYIYAKALGQAKGRYLKDLEVSPSVDSQRFSMAIRIFTLVQHVLPFLGARHSKW
jgi:hypothetical protein